MERVMVLVAAAAVIVIAAMAVPTHAMNGIGYSPPGYCGPQQQVITKMIPCTRTEMVAQVVPTTRVIPVKRIGYKIQNVLVKGTPIGSPCALDPCTKCCPQPFCQVVQQKVPYEYYEQQTIPWYNVVYQPVCRPVMVPQKYLVETTPVCGK